MTTSRLFRRKAKRYRLRVFVKYGSRDLDHRGFTTDISTSGIAIKTNQVYPPGTELLLGLEINERILLARGRVKWAKQVPPTPHQLRALRNGYRVYRYKQKVKKVPLSDRCTERILKPREILLKGPGQSNFLSPFSTSCREVEFKWWPMFRHPHRCSVR